MITADDVRYVLARDTTRAGGTAASLADPDLDIAVESATSEVAARVSGRYLIPGDPTLLPRLLRDITVDVAAYLATLTYRQGKDLTDRDPVVLRYRRAQDLLAGIAEGRIQLPAADDGDGDPDGSAAGASAGPPLNPYSGRLFGMGDVGLGHHRPRTIWG